MRLLTTTIVVLCSFNLLGQEIAKCIEILGTDSLKFYFKSGILVDKECATFYRIAKMSHEGYYFHGQSKDYHLSGQLAIDCHYANNLFHGAYCSFYSNGQMKEKGQFNEGQKNGEWKYWYKNGQLKKLIVFSQQGYFLKDFYKSNGKQLVDNGNGEFNEKDILPGTIMKGEIKNGKQHGNWTISSLITGYKIGVELFENGRFIEGENVALVQSFNNKYFDYPNSLIDLTKDLLNQSYSKKIDCIKYGLVDKRYNSRENELPFYDYVYQNFDPPKFENGYILVGFTIDKSGKLSNISIHSTLEDKLIENQLVAVLNSSDRWEQRTYSGGTAETTELFVFQFYEGTYKILGDSRNDYPPVEYSAQFNNGMDGLVSLIENKNNLPKRFLEKGFNLAVSLSFHVDESGNCINDNSVFVGQIKVTQDERILYNAITEMLKKMEGHWKPATNGGVPTKQYFYGIFTIRDGTPKFRLLSNNWVLK